MTAMACELDLVLPHFGIEQAFMMSDLEENDCTCLTQGCGRMSEKIVRLNMVRSRHRGYGTNILLSAY